MLDDQNDKKLKEAADLYHPAYDDDAWKKMEQLLDEHLPQKKGRRWIIMMTPLLLLCLGGGIYFVVSHNHTISEVSQNAESKNTLAKKQPVKSSPVTPDKSSQGIAGAGKTSAKNSDIPDATKATHVNEKLQNKSGKNLFSQRTVLKSNVSSASSGEEVSNSNSVKNADGVNSSVNSESEQKERIAITENDKDQPKKVNTDVDITAKDNRKDHDIAKNSNSIEKKKSSNPKNSFSKNFGITVSAGPDISGVRFRDAGKVTVSYGAGLRYSISPRFTIRTGFYVSKKIYSAEGYDYHLPAGNPNSNYLQNVNANCNVYAIPLTISYNFGKTKNHNWFAAAGLSSYLMKKEAYKYNYKNLAGQSWSYDWAVANKNEHFFSILDVSGGYEYIFNKRFSIMAEPYISLPLSGIGLGKIKLGSGGVLFTFTVKPF
jgi:hypothetical protein